MRNKFSLLVILLFGLFLVACGDDDCCFELVQAKLRWVEVEVAEPNEPEIEEEGDANEYIERSSILRPYLVRLLPYRYGSYTDGMNVFTFAEDGRVFVQFSRQWSDDPGTELQVAKPPQQWETNIDTINELGRIAAYSLGAGNWYYPQRLVHIEDNTYFFQFTSRGGGSGEAFWCRYSTYFGSVCVNGYFTDLGFGAEHVVWNNGYFYFLDMVEHIRWTPGVGTLGRMNMDGTNRITIVDDLIIGPFQIHNGRIFFSDLESGLAYSVDLAGNDRQMVSERIMPRYHRVWLEFYGSMIINRAWITSGYDITMLVLPSMNSNPAIMCVYGGCLVTFPIELRGHDPFVVLAYNRFMLVLRSNIDDSVWVYSKSCTCSQGHPGASSTVFKSAFWHLERRERGEPE